MSRPQAVFEPYLDSDLDPDLFMRLQNVLTNLDLSAYDHILTTITQVPAQLIPPCYEYFSSQVC